MKKPIRKNRKEKPYQSIFTVLLIAVVVLLIAAFAWKKATPPEPRNVTDKTNIVLQHKKTAPIPSHPTDNAPKKQIPAAPQSEPELNRNLSLSLVGTGIQENDSSFAVIRDDISGEQHLVRQGEIIQKAVLTEIKPGSVLLRLGTLEKILYLEDAEAERKDHPTGSAPDQTPPYSPEEIAAKYNHAKDIKEVMGLMDQIDFSPVPDDSETKGVVIRNIQPNSIFEKIGLQKDDIFISIDGKNIETMDDSFEIYETLRTSSKGSILIQRGNHQETLFYQNDYL